LYLDAAYLPRSIHVPMDFEDREVLEETLSERATHLEPPRSRVEILMPQRGAKFAFLELVEKNAKHSFEQRFRVLKPDSKTIVEALEQALGLPEPPRRIESFDISHLQGSDTVASMVVWEDGKMKKSDYRKFIVRGEWGNDDFASMREIIERRYKRLQEEKKPFPALILIDGGLGQLHAAAQALDKLQVINQAVASIAKQEEIIYVLGQEDQPIRLEHHSPILHLIQQIRDETHRFAVGFHRQRRSKRTIQTGLENIPGVGPRIAHRLLRRFGSVAQLRNASVEQIAKVVPRSLAEKVSAHLAAPAPTSSRVS
jgi:excinuclease ABC subunit C